MLSTHGSPARSSALVFLLLLTFLAPRALAQTEEIWVGSKDPFPVDATRNWFSGGGYSVLYNDGYSMAGENSPRNDVTHLLGDRIFESDTRENYPDIYSLNGAFREQRDWKFASSQDIRHGTQQALGDWVKSQPGMMDPTDPFARQVVGTFERDLASTDFDRKKPWDWGPFGWGGGEQTDAATTRFTADAKQTYWGSVVNALNSPTALEDQPDRETARDYYDGWNANRTWAENANRGTVRISPAAETEMARYDGFLNPPVRLRDGMATVGSGDPGLAVDGGSAGDPTATTGEPGLPFAD